MADQFGVEVEQSNHSLKIARVNTKGKLCVESVPPEEFFVDRNARAVDDAYCVAHRREMRVKDLMGMGYEFDDVIDEAGTGESDTLLEEEDFARRGYYNDSTDDNVKDMAMRPILVTRRTCISTFTAMATVAASRLMYRRRVQNARLHAVRWCPLPF